MLQDGAQYVGGKKATFRRRGAENASWAHGSPCRNSQQHSSETRHQRAATRISVISAGVSAAVTVVIAVTGILQFLVMDGQLEAMRDDGAQMDRLIAANEQLVISNREMTDIARSQFENVASATKREMRAFVSVPEATIDGIAAGRMIEAVILVKNSGQGIANGTLRGTVILSEQVYSGNNHKPTVGAGITIHPNSHATRVARTNAITDQHVAAIESGKLAIVVFGDVRYKDETDSKFICTYRLYFRGGAGTKGRVSEGGGLVLKPAMGGNDCRPN